MLYISHQKNLTSQNVNCFLHPDSGLMGVDRIPLYNMSMSSIWLNTFGDTRTWCDLSDHWARLRLHWAQSGRNHCRRRDWCDRSDSLTCCYGNHFGGGSSRYGPLLCMDYLGSGCTSRLDKSAKQWAVRTLRFAQNVVKEPPSQMGEDKRAWLTDRVPGMTGDARRLLAWKGLGGTPATVFTITFPPTVAERQESETN